MTTTCKCKAEQDARDSHMYVVLCPLHAAAEDMREALRHLLACRWVSETVSEAVDEARAALAKAEAFGHKKHRSEEREYTYKMPIRPHQFSTVRVEVCKDCGCVLDVDGEVSP